MAALAGAGCTSSGGRDAGGVDAPSVGQPGKDVMWVPTSQALIDRMLDMAELTPDDRLVDLGSGDGRTVITAARRGAVAHGIEFDREMVELSRRRAAVAGLAERATFERADIFESDFSDATVVTLFLLPELNLRLRPTLLKMKPGTRVVSNSFDMGNWRPDRTVRVTEGCTSHCTAYKWVVPAHVAGTWAMDDSELELEQTFQMLQGSLRQAGTERSIGDAGMDGARIGFTVGEDDYIGQVHGDRMSGTVNGGRPWTAVRAAR